MASTVEQVVQLFAAAEILLESVGVEMQPGDHAEYEHKLDVTGLQIDESVLQQRGR
jgi:hypothetical protein